MSVRIFWDPEGFELDSLGRKSISGTPADGDTPFVRVAIRMLSIDTPETNYPGVGRPANSDERLSELAHWIRSGHAPIDDALADHLYPRLATGSAGSMHQSQGESAKQFFRELLEQRLTKPNGRKRSLFLRTANQPFDRYGRLLAYIAPSYTTDELRRLSRIERATFNLLMVESGWAAPLVIYPSLARYDDMTLFHQVARRAYEQHVGAWAQPMMLTAYEWRMCIKLHRTTRRLIAGEHLGSSQRRGWVTRYCADVTRLEIVSPQDYHRIEPFNRIFIWPKDVTEAVSRLNLLPLGCQ